jgi:Mg-chelatase subunit ChlD
MYHAKYQTVRDEKQALQQIIDNERMANITRVSKLEDEKKNLLQKISELEKVRSVEGVIIVTDLSGSLDSEQVKLAKEAFRTITSGIKDRNRNAHVGVVVQNNKVTTVRAMSKVDQFAENVVNSAVGGGAENYHTTLKIVQELLVDFRSKHAKAKCRVILIGDGEACDGFPNPIVRQFVTEKTKIHNVVVEPKLKYGSFSAGIQRTSTLSSKTKGHDFTYSGSSSELINDTLLGRSKKK